MAYEVSLTGRTAVITGSNSGIGLGIAWELARAGADVVLNSFTDTDDDHALAREIASQTGVKARYVQADMSRSDDCRRLVADGCDILVNNAGIQHVAKIEDFSTEEWDQIIAINLTSSFHTMRHAIPLMKEKGKGRIINIASAHALVASPFKSAYVAAKHGILGLTKTAALELAEFGITVNAICPGYVLTPLVERQIPDTARERGISEEQVKTDVMLRLQATKEFVSIEEVAATAVYLASDAARQVTGTHISIDGGWTAQ